MRVSERYKVGISRYQPTDADDLHKFQLDHFGESTRQVDPARRDWLFEQNPCRDPAGPGLWVCRRDGVIVGQQAEIPFDLQVGRDRQRASWAVDLMVDEAWRIRGVGPALMATMVEDRSISLGLNLSDKGYAAFVRSGWTDLGIVPVYLRPLDARRSLAVAPVPARVRGLAPVVDPALRALDAAVGALTRAVGAHLVAVDRFDDRLDEIWAGAADHYSVLSRRDLAATGWRIDQRPDAARLRRYYLVRGGRALGYVVLRPTTWSNEPVVIVTDYLAAPRWVPALLLAAGRDARSDGAVAMAVKTRNEPADRGLRATGFLRREQGVDPPIQFVVRCTDEAGICALVSDPASWFVTSADSDLEYATTTPVAEPAIAQRQ
jgi:GNAT superfamily N-acetyltransferase